MYFLYKDFYPIMVNFGFYYSYDMSYNIIGNLDSLQQIKKSSLDRHINIPNQIISQDAQNPLIYVKNCSLIQSQNGDKNYLQQRLNQNLQIQSSPLTNRIGILKNMESIQINKKTEKQMITIQQKYNKKNKQCLTNQKSKKIKKFLSKHQQYQDYNPHEKIKKTNDLVYKQNENRNIIPNQVNQMFSYIQKSSKSSYILQRLFKKYPPVSQIFTFKRFYLYQSLLKHQITNYINQNSLFLVTRLYEPKCQVFSQEQQRYYNKICRILIHHFLQQDSIFNILTSKRMKNFKKKRHLQIRRVLKDKALQILKS